MNTACYISSFQFGYFSGYLYRWNGTEVSDLRADLEMFSSYIVSSVTSDDALYNVKHRKRINDVTIHFNQVSFIDFEPFPRHLTEGGRMKRSLDTKMSE